MFSGMTLVANPALTEYKWQSAGGDYSGSFDDSAHWDKGAVPGALSKAVFNRDASYTLSFPLGVYARFRHADHFEVTRQIPHDVPILAKATLF